MCQDLAGMSRYIDADFRHYLHCKSIETVFLNAAAVNFDQVATKIAAESLRHLTSARVSSAEKQDIQSVSHVLQPLKMPARKTIRRGQ